MCVFGFNYESYVIVFLMSLYVLICPFQFNSSHKDLCLKKTHIPANDFTLFHWCTGGGKLTHQETQQCAKKGKEEKEC